MNIASYQVSQHSHYNLGSMCIYKGSLKSLVNIDVYGDEEQQEDIVPNEDILEINSRDFLAALHRLSILKYQQFTKENLSNSETLSLNRDPIYGEYYGMKYINRDANHDDHNELGAMSVNIIKALIQSTTDKDPAVREAAIRSIGLINLPEAGEAVDALVKSLYDQDSQIRAIAAWAIGKVGEICNNRATKRLTELLRDSYWKVRTAACIALGYMGENIDPNPSSILLKVLKDGAVNKLTVCETLVRLGVQGEQILIDVLKNLPNSNYIMKAAIIQSLELANVNFSTIDFVIEELFKNSG